MIDLLPDERIDDLQCKGHQIIQNPNMFCFWYGCGAACKFCKAQTGWHVHGIWEQEPV